MATLSDPRLLTWTVPTPRGLWYRSIIVIDQGLFITPDIDTSTMEALKKAASAGTEELVSALTSHGRFKRPRYLSWSTLEEVRHSPTTGTIELVVEGEEAVSVVIADRDRSEKLARVLHKTWKAQTESV